MQILVTGADQGERGTVGVIAKLLIFDTEAERVVHEIEYETPAALRTPEHKVQFTGACFRDGALYVCTHNELVVFTSWPPVEPTRTFSLPGFNDLHDVYDYGDCLAVANTGLETVDLVSDDGKLLHRYDLLRDETDVRCIDAAVDYRLIPDTKPHARHANHLFEFEGGLWTSQLNWRNAICVTHAREPLAVDVGMPHDGDWINGRLVFTTTNGHIVFFDHSRCREVLPLVDLTPGLQQLGWCRGVCAVPDDPQQICVGFSSLRRSKWKDYAYFVKHGHALPSSRIAIYDLRRRTLAKSWQLGPGMGYQIFQLLALDETRYV